MQDAQTLRRNFLWNTFGQLTYMLCQFLCGILVVRLAGEQVSGVYNTALTATGIFLSIASYGMYSFQVSDIRGKYGASTYIRSRVWTCALAVALCIGFVAVSALTGRPLMLFNSEGKTVWRPGQTSLWGLALSLPADTGYPDPRGELDPEAAPGLLYAGQWQDVESGLCYNRFRYYEPETGMYLVSDPLGLQGGEQTYRYVPNPLRWIDPLGLNKGASLSKMMNSSSDLMGLRRQPQNFWRLYRGKDI